MTRLPCKKHVPLRLNKDGRCLDCRAAAKRIRMRRKKGWSEEIQNQKQQIREPEDKYFMIKKYQIKTAEEIALELGMDARTINEITIRAMQKIRAYLSKPRTRINTGNK